MCRHVSLDLLVLIAACLGLNRIWCIIIKQNKKLHVSTCIYQLCLVCISIARGKTCEKINWVVVVIDLICVVWKEKNDHYKKKKQTFNYLRLHRWPNTMSMFPAWIGFSIYDCKSQFVIIAICDHSFEMPSITIKKIQSWTHYSRFQVRKCVKCELSVHIHSIKNY